MPTDSVTANINITAALTFRQSVGVVGPRAGTNQRSLNEVVSVADQLLSGTGAVRTCDQGYAEQIIFTAAAPQTLRFAASTLMDPLGNPIAMARIRLIIAQVVDPTPGFDLEIYRAASNGIPWLPTSSGPAIVRANGGLLVFYDPTGVGAGQGNVISPSSDGMVIDPGPNLINAANVVVIGSSVA